MRTDQFIVKVQLPLFASDGAPVLIYNEDKSRHAMVEVSAKEFNRLSNKMDGEPKGYFYAHAVHGEIVLDEIAPWQSW